jgi:hypothetical protein
MNVSALFTAPGLNIVALPEPAAPQALAALQSQSPMPLPDLYLQLLATTNGPECELGIAPGWLQLWPAEKVVEYNRAYQVATYHPGYFAFGSSGGGEMFALSIAHGGESPVYDIPFDSIDSQDVSVVAPGFAAFLIAFGRHWLA